MRIILLTVAVISGATAAPQEPRPVPFTSPVRVVKRGDERLHGIRMVDILVGNLSAAAARCGLLKGSLQQAARDALTTAQLGTSISEKDRSWFYTVHVTSDTIATSGRCVTALRTRLVTQVDGVPEVDRFATSGEWGSLLVGEMVLIEESALVESAAADHAARVRHAIREHTSTVGTRVKAANQ